MDWSRDGLETRVPRFVPFGMLREVDVPGGPVVYVVYRASMLPPHFLEGSVGGHFKGRDPSLSQEELALAADQFERDIPGGP